MTDPIKEAHECGKENLPKLVLGLHEAGLASLEMDKIMEREYGSRGVPIQVKFGAIDNGFGVEVIRIDLFERGSWKKLAP